MQLAQRGQPVDEAVHTRLKVLTEQHHVWTALAGIATLAPIVVAACLSGAAAAISTATLEVVALTLAT